MRGKGSELGGHLAAQLGEGEREQAGWSPSSRTVPGEVEIAGEKREKYWLVAATSQVAPNRRDAWSPRCRKGAGANPNAGSSYQTIAMRAPGTRGQSC